MGFFFDLMQQAELEKQRNQADGLEQRVDQLEDKLNRTIDLLSKTLAALETHLDKDIDGDGRTG